MKLSSIVAKEIRRKHLKEDIRQAELRHKYRKYKLKQRYELPHMTSCSFYFYSNFHGNIFLSRHQNPHPFPNSEPFLQQLLSEINNQVYDLWVTHRELDTNFRFSSTRNIISLGLFFVITFLLVLSIWAQLCSKEVREFLGTLALWAIVSIIAISGGALTLSLRKQYVLFDYDNEIVKLLVQILRKNSQDLEDMGLSMECDRQMTWICFFPISDLSIRENEFNINLKEQHSREGKGKGIFFQEESSKEKQFNSSIDQKEDCISQQISRSRVHD